MAAPGPYARAARAYLASGWGSPLPLPPGKKQSPPEGWTGRAAPQASAADVESWCEDRGDGNIAMRLHPGVIGIDVDAYKGGQAAEAWERLVAEHGPLPDAPLCTSRDDGVSGIRLFRVPHGYSTGGAIGPAGEVIQHHHRYVVVPPSVSPPPPAGTGRPYRWVNRPDGRVPRRDELPVLPTKWQEALRSATATAGGGGTTWTDPDIERLATRGIPAGANQDEHLRDLAYKLARQEVPRPVAHAVWAAVVSRTPLARPGEPWTDADFQRHWRGAVAKARAAPEAPPPIPPCDLPAAEETFRRWLHLDDLAPLHAVAAALVANQAPGDPVWLLLVGAPSTGKTEILTAAVGLPWVRVAAKVTEAALLSGTPSRDRSRHATGGLLREIGAFGVLLCKDFTSVLAQNQDTRNQGLAALRDIYDGRWDRPVGTEGARVLAWAGKCGLIGGVTPALDGYHQVISLLGDRFLLLRFPKLDATAAGRKALAHRGREKQMRAELTSALCGLVAGASTDKVNRPLEPGEQEELIRLAAYTARARAGVARDGYTRSLLYLPEAEGPGRLITAYARMLGGMEAIGCPPAAAWQILRRIAADCAPATRSVFASALLSHAGPARTSDLAAAAGMATKNARVHLEDLSLLGLAERSKAGTGATSADMWEASPELHELWPVGLNAKVPVGLGTSTGSVGLGTSTRAPVGLGTNTGEPVGLGTSAVAPAPPEQALFKGEPAGQDTKDGVSTENYRGSYRDALNVNKQQYVDLSTSTEENVSLLPGIGLGTSSPPAAPGQGEPPADGLCAVCGKPLPPHLAEAGDQAHPECDPWRDP